MLLNYIEMALIIMLLFVDGQGNVLANKTVKFNINGVFYTKPTDANGTARLNIWLYPGKYILTAYNPINNEAKACNVTVFIYY